jgi:hypothetical protein
VNGTVAMTSTGRLAAHRRSTLFLNPQWIRPLNPGFPSELVSVDFDLIKMFWSISKLIVFTPKNCKYFCVFL